MLVLTRSPGQAIMIGDDIEVGVRQLPGEDMTLAVSSRHPVPLEGDPERHLRIGHAVDVRVLARMRTKLRVGIECPPRMPVFRREIFEEIQGSHPAFEPREPSPLVAREPPDLARWFTRDARRALAHARADAVFASETGAPKIGSGYVLLGLLRVEGVAAGALGALGVRAEDVRARLAELHREDAGADHRFTARARRILELAHRQALALGDDRIDTEHLLLAMLRAGQGDALEILAEKGLSYVRIRDEIVRELLDRGWRPPKPGG